MRVTNEQVWAIFERVVRESLPTDAILISFARAVLAEAARTTTEADYQGIERRGFEVSRPGVLR